MLMADIYEQAGGRWAVTTAAGTASYATEEEARLSTMQAEPALTRWQRLSLERVGQGAQLIDGLATNGRLRPTVEAAIAATAPGEAVAGTSWTRENAADVLAVWDALAAFLQAPVREGGPTPIEVISRYA